MNLIMLLFSHGYSYYFMSPAEQPNSYFQLLSTLLKECFFLMVGFIYYMCIPFIVKNWKSLMLGDIGPI